MWSLCRAAGILNLQNQGLQVNHGSTTVHVHFHQSCSVIIRGSVRTVLFTPRTKSLEAGDYFSWLSCCIMFGQVKYRTLSLKRSYLLPFLDREHSKSKHFQQSHNPYFFFSQAEIIIRVFLIKLPYTNFQSILNQPKIIANTVWQTNSELKHMIKINSRKIVTEK